MHPGVWANVPPRVDKSMLEQSMSQLLSREELEISDPVDMVYLVYFGDQSAVCVKYQAGMEPRNMRAIKADDSNMIVAVKLKSQPDRFLFPEPFNNLYIRPSTAALVGTYFY